MGPGCVCPAKERHLFRVACGSRSARADAWRRKTSGSKDGLGHGGRGGFCHAVRDAGLRESVITDFTLSLGTVLEELPVAVALVSPTGQVIGKTGGMCGLLGAYVPSFNTHEALRWSFHDASGLPIPPRDWPSGRALRGERHYEGMIGSFLDGEVRKVKVTSMPTFDPTSDVAAVSFLQVLDARKASVEGSYHDLQERLIDHLVKAISLTHGHHVLSN